MHIPGETLDYAESFDPTGTHTLEVFSKASRFNKWMYNKFRQHLKGEVLEIGSGIGNISKLAIADNLSITLSDYNPAYCKSLSANFSAIDNVREILQIDLLSPDFELKYSNQKEKFDSIFLLNVIEHIEDDIQAVANCRFMLKQGGHLILLAPAYKWLYCNFDKELGHYRRYTRNSMMSLFQINNLDINETKFFNFLGIGGWAFFGRILKRKLIGKKEMSVFDILVPLGKLTDKLFLNKIGLSIIITGKKN